MQPGTWVRVCRIPILSGDRVGAKIDDVGQVRAWHGSCVYIDFSDYNPARRATTGVKGHTWALQHADVEAIEQPNLSNPQEGREW